LRPENRAIDFEVAAEHLQANGVAMIDTLILALVAFGFATMCFIGKSIEGLLTDIRDELKNR